MYLSMAQLLSVYIISKHFFFRDASLKLLVVPRDEDILQMAYQNSVYRSGSEPHRGGASEIPEPPPVHRPVPSYAARGRHMSDSAISVHRSKHHPSHQKYKAELRVLPEDGTGAQVKYLQLFWSEKYQRLPSNRNFVEQFCKRSLGQSW